MRHSYPVGRLKCRDKLRRQPFRARWRPDIRQIWKPIAQRLPPPFLLQGDCKAPPGAFEPGLRREMPYLPGIARRGALKGRGGGADYESET